MFDFQCKDYKVCYSDCSTSCTRFDMWSFILQYLKTHNFVLFLLNLYPLKLDIKSCEIIKMAKINLIKDELFIIERLEK